MEMTVYSQLKGGIDMEKQDFINLGYVHKEDTVYFEIYLKSGAKVFPMPEDVVIELATVNKRITDAPIIKQIEGINVDVETGKLYGFLAPEIVKESGCIHGQFKITGKGKVKTPIFHFELGRIIEEFKSWY